MGIFFLSNLWLLSFSILSIWRYRFDFILDQVRVYESKLQQQQTQFEEKTKQFDEVLSEKGNFISKVIYHFNDGNVFVCAYYIINT
jgi:hypothetical protein